MISFHKYLLPMVAVAIIAAVAKPVRRFMENDERESKDALIRKHLLSDIALYGNDKPKLWVFAGTSKPCVSSWRPIRDYLNADLSEPYISECVKSIIKKCSADFNVIIVDDETMSKFLPDWDVSLTRVAGNERRMKRIQGLARLLQRYGGMVVPASFLCFESPIRLLSKTPFVVNTTSKGRNAAEFKNEPRFAPNLLFMGAQVGCPAIGKLVNFLESADEQFRNSQEDLFLDVAGKFAGDIMTVVPARVVGAADNEGKPVGLEELFSVNGVALAPDALGVYFDNDEIARRNKYNWFSDVAIEHVIESDLAVGRYFKRAQTEDV